MIEVEMPDGTIAEFPDGTSQDVMRSALQKRFGAPQALPPSPEQPSEPTAWDTAKDIGGAFAAGAARGAADLVGLPGTISDFTNNALSRAFGLPQLPQSPLSGNTAREAASVVTGGATDYEGEHRGAKFAGTIGEFVPGAVAFGGGSLSNIGRFAVLPGAASEAAGQATEGTWAEPYARAGAALLAPALPALGRRLITPNPISGERQAMVDYLRSEGVSPTAGQSTGNRGLRYSEAELGGGATANILDQQGRAFTDAAMRRAGGSGLADEAGMTALQKRLSDGFTNISSRTTLTSDAQLGNDIGATLNRYGRLLETQQKPIIEGMADDIVARLASNGGKMSGVDYQAIRSDLSTSANSASNANLKGAFKGLRDALDNAMARSVSPDDAATWAQLRREYGNMKVLEKAAAGAGEAAGAGIISPAKLRQSAAAGRAGQYVRGEGDFDRLARSGDTILRPLPDSGTASRVNAKTLGGISGALGAGGGAAAGGPYGAIIGALMGSVAPAAAGRALMSRPVQAYLSNQLLAPTRLIDPRYAGILEELVSGERARIEGKGR